jgi:topoisomerase-4 subunit A
MSEINDTLPEDKDPTDDTLHDQLAVADMYQNWFLDYASYVILERAVPNIEDGLKPVQRRILHALKEMDDGRFNKVANVIGSTMQYHPHGDASINEALVNMGQKDLVFDTQGSWGIFARATVRRQHDTLKFGFLNLATTWSLTKIPPNGK